MHERNLNGSTLSALASPDSKREMTNMSSTIREMRSACLRIIVRNRRAISGSSIMLSSIRFSR